jgi:hypothetical protein
VNVGDCLCVWTFSLRSVSLLWIKQHPIPRWMSLSLSQWVHFNTFFSFPLFYVHLWWEGPFQLSGINSCDAISIKLWPTINYKIFYPILTILYLNLSYCRFSICLPLENHNLSDTIYLLIGWKNVLAGGGSGLLVLWSPVVDASGGSSSEGRYVW